MTFSELSENVKKLKVSYFGGSLDCNLFSPEYYAPERFPDIGIYVVKKNDKWEVYFCERGWSELECIFYTECDLYEYIFCCYKQHSDYNRWF